MKKKATASLPPLLWRMSRIERMERGKICRLSGRPHYNHQAWHEGRNVARYVPAEQVPSLQEAIEGYHLYMELAHQYADQVIERTRRAISLSAPTAKRRRPRTNTKNKRSRIKPENV